MTTIVNKRLIIAKYALTTPEVEYTANGCRTIIDKFTGTNQNAVPVELSILILPPGGLSSSAEFRLLNRKEIASRGTWMCPEVVGHVLEPNESLVVLASLGASITIRASGREIT